MTIQEYISELQRQYATGNATEHSYRPALQRLLQSLLPRLTVTNEPTRQDYGVPDFILTRRENALNIPIAFVEAKNIDDSDLGGRNRNKAQFERYRESLDHIAFTDYLEFRFYEGGDFKDSVRIGETRGNRIESLPENHAKFARLIFDLGNSSPQRITSASKLATVMAAKTRLLADTVEKIVEDENEDENEIRGQMEAFKRILIHDMTAKQFADAYAQTIAYGMFAARLHDRTPDDFSRMEAATLIPRTNPFMRQLFQHIAGFDLDRRIEWIVNDLAETFRLTDMPRIMAGFGSSDGRRDPLIHFYEEFLSAYDPQERKNRGVWYTPQSVVSFMVRAVDEILEREFGLENGLANTSKTIRTEMTTIRDRRYTDGYRTYEETYDKVQILDPATGTGTFLAEIVRRIYEKFRGQEGMWQGYVSEHLLPRLNGFELLVASYVMAHLKIDWILTETGYRFVDDRRIRIFLTNSLEVQPQDTSTLWGQFLANEAKQADKIKNDTPVMVVIGNPPYNGESPNKISDDFLWDYKIDESGRKVPNTKWLNNDYVKFIRLGQKLVEKNHEGILAYITDNSYLESPSFRGMRYNLLKNFDKIYLLDLHGNSKKGENSIETSSDENVFNIQQGVVIAIFIKLNELESRNELAKVYHSEYLGKKIEKFDFLNENTIDSIDWEEIDYRSPDYFFKPRDYTHYDSFMEGVSIESIFPKRGVGICSKRDETAIRPSKASIKAVINDFNILSLEEIKRKYRTEINESRDKRTDTAKQNVMESGADESLLKPILYRPFDVRWTYHTDRSKGFLAFPVYEIMRHFHEENIGLIVTKQSRQKSLGYMFITKNITDLHILDSVADSTYVMPLYIYNEDGCRRANLDSEIVGKISEKIGMEYEEEKSGDGGKFSPIDVLDYIYGILHSLRYREKYKDFLKTDFPRIPYPESRDEFARYAEAGSRLRRVHLLEGDTIGRPITGYPASGSDIVEKVRYEATNDDVGRVWINETQYFENVPLQAWDFYVGGYQPAQKWLKDRRGEKLGYEDIMHYQRLIKALVMTQEIMDEIEG